MRKLSILLAIILLLATAVPCFAIADPDSPPQINAVYIYEDCLETGDIGILCDIFIEYAALPTETVTDSYLVAFIDIDGTTQLKAVQPYAYSAAGEKGYNRNLAWIYFTAAEVTTMSIDAADILLYSIWLMGNPTITSGWPGAPPKTIGNIDTWYTTGSAATLLALRVIYYAGVLGPIWSLDLLDSTPLGNRLTTAGEEYFTNVISNLRTIAPTAFPAGTVDPVYPDIDTPRTFGATMTNLGGTVGGSPITLVSGANTVNVTASGTFTLELANGTTGTAASIAGGSVVTGSPVTLVSGTNTITASNAGTGNALITVALTTTQTTATGTITGTGFDLTTLATHFGMNVLLFSSLVWLLISVLICAAVYKVSSQNDQIANFGASKVVLVVFNICIVGGALLGILNMIMAAVMFILFGIFTAYVLFFRNANV